MNYHVVVYAILALGFYVLGWLRGHKVASKVESVFDTIETWSQTEKDKLKRVL